MLKLITKTYNPYHTQQPLWRRIQLHRARVLNIPSVRQQHMLVLHYELENLEDKTMTDEPFPSHPNLRRFAHSDRYGDMELLSLDRTSDGSLIGWARVHIGTKNEHEHSIFIGEPNRVPGTLARVPADIDTTERGGQDAMTRHQIKERAQDELMHALQTAFNEFTLDELRPDMDRQMTRIEKLFGYKPGSWIRGVS